MYLVSMIYMIYDKPVVPRVALHVCYSVKILMKF